MRFPPSEAAVLWSCVFSSGPGRSQTQLPEYTCHGRDLQGDAQTQGTGHSTQKRECSI